MAYKYSLIYLAVFKPPIVYHQMFGQIFGSQNYTKNGYYKANCNVYATQWLLFETILARFKPN